jgi:hypothetical protein
MRCQNRGNHKAILGFEPAADPPTYHPALLMSLNAPTCTQRLKWSSSLFSPCMDFLFRNQVLFRALYLLDWLVQEHVTT